MGVGVTPASGEEERYLDAEGIGLEASRGHCEDHILTFPLHALLLCLPLDLYGDPFWIERHPSECEAPLRLLQ